SIEELPEDFTADLVAMTVITGNAPRAYELAAQMRAKNIPVVLGGPHVTLLPQEALQHADTVCTGYSEQSWPQLIRDFMAGNMQREYRQ
ncbi:cobalamin-dependent protein, partial [Klebsiella pneumoniae]|nr:cobalamin-dependent protein [Klebsiella pneumoniae]